MQKKYVRALSGREWHDETIVLQMREELVTRGADPEKLRDVAAKLRAANFSGESIRRLAQRAAAAVIAG